MESVALLTTLVLVAAVIVLPLVAVYARRKR
jgi:hypothetical protein